MTRTHRNTPTSPRMRNSDQRYSPRESRGNQRAAQNVSGALRRGQGTEQGSFPIGVPDRSSAVDGDEAGTDLPAPVSRASRSPRSTPHSGRSPRPHTGAGHRHNSSRDFDVRIRDDLADYIASRYAVPSLPVDDEVFADLAFDEERETYITNVACAVEQCMGESIRALRGIMQRLMSRTQPTQGLTPEDVSSLMGRAAYDTPAIMLAEALPTLCRSCGHDCGLKLFDEACMTSNPRRYRSVLQRVYDACGALCDSSDRWRMGEQMRAYVPALVQHIDEDTLPESPELQRLKSEVLYAVREVKGAHLSAVLRAASEDLDAVEPCDNPRARIGEQFMTVLAAAPENLDENAL